jgi:uncharacterized MnhB-related membrane protein
VLQLGILALVAIAGTCVALTRSPANQSIGVSLFGLILGMMFMVFAAPDVALSQIVVGAVGLPLMILLALSKIRRDESLQKNREPSKGAKRS